MVAILNIAVLIGLLASAYSEDQPEDGTHVTVTRDQNGPAAPKSSTMTNKFCEAKSGLICPKGNVLQIGGKNSKFTPVPYLCHSLCVRDNACRNAHWGEDRMCTIKDESCADDELVPGPGIDFMRLPRGESCPAERPEYVKPAEMYTTTFCAMYGKKCPGHNMYNRPQNIRPWINCLKKCLAIVECASVDFVGDKCVINDYHCPDEELVDAEPGDINFMRLPKGYSGDGAPGCPSNRAPAPPGGGPIPPIPEPPAEEPAETPAEPSAETEPTTPAPCLCPCNATQDADGKCQCDAGFKKEGDKCVPDCPMT